MAMGMRRPVTLPALAQTRRGAPLRQWHIGVIGGVGLGGAAEMGIIHLHHIAILAHGIHGEHPAQRGAGFAGDIELAQFGQPCLHRLACQGRPQPFVSANIDAIGQRRPDAGQQPVIELLGRIHHLQPVAILAGIELEVGKARPVLIGRGIGHRTLGIARPHHGYRG